MLQKSLRLKTAYSIQIEGYNAKKIALKKALEVTIDRLDATKKLNEKGFAQKAVLLELESKEAGIQSELAISDTEIAKAEQEITKTDIDLINLDNKFLSQTLTDLKEAQSQLAGHRERFIYLQEALSRVVLKSPVDGVVNNLNFHTIGSSIPPGQTIVEISPINDLLVIEAKIEPKSIDSITVGLSQKLDLAPLNQEPLPHLQAK